MKKLLFLSLLFLTCTVGVSRAQIEKMIIERYYVSDSLDATDTTGGYLEPGSVTYRIFIDMYPGCKLTKIYGDSLHPIRIASTEKFFNNRLDGQTFAKDFLKVRYSENTVALDSWLTLGQTTRISNKTYFGIPKDQDRDGSFIGGSHNDGGSAGIAAGLISNNDPSVGILVTVSDGMDTMNTHPSNWADYGIFDFATGVDSTIFGSSKESNLFESTNVGLQNSGISGIDPDSNQVLIAQLTTKGEISFDLNVELVDTNGAVRRYVSTDHFLGANEQFCRFLKYPYVPSCGCPDPSYVEFNSSRDCDNHDSCKTKIVFGCMDPIACNFDPSATFHVPAMCCYPGYCNDRRLDVVCPELSNGKQLAQKMNVYPNPFTGELKLDFQSDGYQPTEVAVFNSTGQQVYVKTFAPDELLRGVAIDMHSFVAGVYLLRVNNGWYTGIKSITKN